MDRRAQRLIDNLAQVRERIAIAALAAGRQPDEVRLIAVVKYVDVALARLLVAAGCGDLGESRPQELRAKAAALADSSVRWHMIGHLQRNKIRSTLPLAGLIHSVDSLRLLRALEDEAAAAGLTAHILLEVNVSGEPAKHGFDAPELSAAIEQVARLGHVRLEGLMCMAGLEGGAAAAERDFARLRQLRDEHRDRDAGGPLTELSMGMSGDYEIAIRHGATMIRVGSALFEGLDV